VAAPGGASPARVVLGAALWRAPARRLRASQRLGNQPIYPMPPPPPPHPPQSGMLDKYGVELIGAKLPSIDRAEDRELFKQAMIRIGLKVGGGGVWGGGGERSRMDGACRGTLKRGRSSPPRSRPPNAVRRRPAAHRACVASIKPRAAATPPPPPSHPPPPPAPRCPRAAPPPTWRRPSQSRPTSGSSRSSSAPPSRSAARVRRPAAHAGSCPPARLRAKLGTPCCSCRHGGLRLARPPSSLVTPHAPPPPPPYSHPHPQAAASRTTWRSSRPKWRPASTRP
jgi:hypothetical protein